MGEIKWIKISTDIFDNRKIKQIEHMPEGDALIVIWFKLLILAGDTNDGGQVYLTQEIPYTEPLLANQFNKPLPLIQLALRTFEQFSMIEIIDDIIHISNWEKYQNIDGMEKIREQNRLRKQAQRERERIAMSDVTLLSRDTSRDVTEQNKNKNKNKNENIYRTTNVVLPHPSPAEDEFEVVEEEDDLPFEEEKAEAKSPLSKTQQKRFDSFWNAYPKKVAKQDALKAWKKISPDDELTNQILVGLENSKQHDSRFKDPQYIPYPASWLNSGCWEDEFSDEVVFSDEKPKKAQQTKPTQKNYQFGNGNSSFDAEQMFEDAVNRTRRKMKHDRDNNT